MHALTGYLDFPPEERAETVALLRAVTVRSRADAGCVHSWWPEEVARPHRFRLSVVNDRVWRAVGDGSHVLTVSERQPVPGG